jgi:hypothetical protein
MGKKFVLLKYIAPQHPFPIFSTLFLFSLYCNILFYSSYHFVVDKYQARSFLEKYCGL